MGATLGLCEDCRGAHQRAGFSLSTGVLLPRLFPRPSGLSRPWGEAERRPRVTASAACKVVFSADRSPFSSCQVGVWRDGCLRLGAPLPHSWPPPQRSQSILLSPTTAFTKEVLLEAAPVRPILLGTGLLDLRTSQPSPLDVIVFN